MMMWWMYDDVDVINIWWWWYNDDDDKQWRWKWRWWIVTLKMMMMMNSDSEYIKWQCCWWLFVESCECMHCWVIWDVHTFMISPSDDDKWRWDHSET